LADKAGGILARIGTAAGVDNGLNLNNGNK